MEQFDGPNTIFGFPVPPPVSKAAGPS